MDKHNKLPGEASRVDHEAESSASGSVVHATDMRELSSFLGLMIDQINLLLQESNGSVGDLIESITMMAASISKIEQQLPELNAATNNLRQYAADEEATDRADVLVVSDTIKTLCAQAETDMQKAVTAFQFYDRLSQRILHIQENLQAVSEVTRAQDKQHQALWQRLHDKMRSVYTLEQEQSLYYALLQRLSAEGLNSVATSSNRKEKEGVAISTGEGKPSLSGDIELF
ncbi:MAG: hypothetical protein HKP12_01710 [Gammaproteobacteria bacterium]|nr:hypothetical protein [Gammaproteobacteria bacterium]NNJ95859.1 hypothetical protein [Gammaproteobacteria bacterium]